jgi:hypothetical protein
MNSDTPRTNAAIDPDLAWNEAVFADFARQLERELNETRDQLTAALLLCADNGINVKSKTVAAMPNEKADLPRTDDAQPRSGTTMNNRG